MKRTSLFKKIIATAFAAVIVFTVSVLEVHYLFSNSHQQTHEHCENHLHDASHHEDCSVCKFNIATFTDEVFTTDNSPLAFVSEKVVGIYQSPITNSLLSFPSLRGPPAIA